MATVRFDTTEVIDWDSFHETFKQIMGFPDFYGRNMNAWIDCLTYLDEGDGMSKFHLSQGEKLNIEITDTIAFKERLPDIFAFLIECTAHVNQRYIETDKLPALSLIFLGTG